jgi:hypothetical protein
MRERRRTTFRQSLKAAVAADPDRPYWESWMGALEDLLLTVGLVPADVLHERLHEDAAPRTPGRL